MIPKTLIDLHLGDVVRLRKDHACGGTDWSVVRLGADLGLRCATCGRRILLSRSQFERRLRQFVSHVNLSGPLSEIPEIEGSEAESTG